MISQSAYTDPQSGYLALARLIDTIAEEQGWGSDRRAAALDTAWESRQQWTGAEGVLRAFLESDTSWIEPGWLGALTLAEELDRYCAYGFFGTCARDYQSDDEPKLARVCAQAALTAAGTLEAVQLGRWDVRTIDWALASADDLNAIIEWTADKLPDDPIVTFKIGTAGLVVALGVVAYVTLNR